MLKAISAGLSQFERRTLKRQPKILVTDIWKAVIKTKFCRGQGRQGPYLLGVPLATAGPLRAFQRYNTVYYGDYDQTTGVYMGLLV